MGFLSSLFGSQKKPATTTTTIQQQIPPELSPFVKEVLGDAQKLYKADLERGYDPYTGQTIAPFTAEEERAMEGISGLVGTMRPFIKESEEIYRTGAEKFTPETAQEYMSPYQRAVTDIEKREAGRQFDIAQQSRDASAAGAGAGSLMGTRSAILEAEAQRNQQQLLSDIEARGLQKAYQDSQRLFSEQKARERQMAGDLARTGSGLFQAGLTEAGAEQRVGEQRRALGQSALDEAFKRFEEERDFPQQTLAQYQGSIYGNPLLSTPSQVRTTANQQFQPSMGQSILGLGLTGLNIFGTGGGFGQGGFSPNMFFTGKRAKTGGGIASLPVVKKYLGGTASGLEQAYADDDIPFDIGSALGDVNKRRIVPEVTEEQIRTVADIEGQEKIGKDQISMLTQLAQKEEQDLKKLSDPYFSRRKEAAEAGVGLKRAAARQKFINALMGPKGIIGGIPEGSEKYLEDIGNIEADVAAKLSQADTEEFGAKKEAIKSKYKTSVDILNKNTELKFLVNKLPFEARDKFLKYIKDFKSLEIDEQKIRQAAAKALMESAKFQVSLEKLKLQKEKAGIDRAKIPESVKDLIRINPDAAIVALKKANYKDEDITDIIYGDIKKGKPIPSKGQMIQDRNKVLENVRKIGTR